MKRERKREGELIRMKVGKREGREREGIKEIKRKKKKLGRSKR